MKKAIIKITSLLLASILILSCAPLDVIADYDFKSAFGTMAKAVNDYLHPCTLGKMSYVTENGELVCIDEDDNGGLFTQASDDLIMTKGETRDVHVAVNDSEGNPINDFGYISWSASPSGYVILDVHDDTRYCTITVLSDATPITLTMVLHISEKYGGGTQTRTRKITFSGLNFEYPHYYIMVGETSLLTSLSGLAISASADWKPSEDKGITSLSDSHYEFTSSDESILQVTGKTGYGSKTFTLIPKVKGLKEGETTLTVKTSTGEKASCKVTVVGYKEYDVKIISKELKIPLPEAELTHNDLSTAGLSTQAVKTYYTNSNGITRIKIPDPLYYPINVTIDSDYHTIYSFRTENLKKDIVNELLVNMDEVDTSQISMSSDELKGPAITVFDKEVDLFKLMVKSELDFGKAEVNINWTEKKVEVMWGREKGGNAAIQGPGTGYWNEAYNDVKKLYKACTGNSVTNNKLWNSFSSLRGKLKKVGGSLGVDIEGARVGGYAEISFATGKPKFLEGGFVAYAGVDVDFSVKWPSFPMVYGTFGLEADLTGKIFLTHKKDMDFDVGGSLGLQIIANLGVGVGDKSVLETYIEGGVQGDFDNTLKVTLKSVRNGLTSTFTGSLYLTGVCIGFDILKATWPFYKTTIYPHRETVSPQSLPETFAEVKETAQSISRDYLNNKNELTTEAVSEYDYYIDSLYPYSKPQIAELNNGTKILIWIDDLGTKNDVNKTSIMYSVYNGSAWSEAKCIYEDGAYSGSPVIYNDGNSVYVVWQKANNALDNSATMNELMSNIDLYCSTFSGSGFSAPVNINAETDSTFELAHSVCAVDGGIAVSWIENSENNVFLSTGTNIIYYKTFKNNTWSDKKIITSDAGEINSLATGKYGNEIAVAYSVGSEDNYQLYLFRNGSLVQVDSGIETYENLALNSDCLYYLNGGEVMSYNLSNGTISAFGAKNISNFKILNGKSKTVLLTLVSDGLRCDLFAADLVNGEWSPMYQITDFDKYIRSYSAYLDKNDAIQIAANVVEVNPDSNDFYSKSSLVYAEFNEMVNLGVDEYIMFDYNDVEAGKSIPLKVNVTNYGKTEINSFVVKITDEVAQTSQEINIKETIAGGETKEIEFEYTLPKNLTKRTINVEICCENDIDTTNNISILEIGYADAEISDYSITRNGFISASISNNGYETASDVIVSVYKLNDGYELLSQTEIGTLLPGETKDFSYDVDDSLITFSSYFDYNTFKVEISTSNEEWDYLNNVAELMIAPIRAESVTFEPSTKVIMVGEKYTLNAVVYPENASCKDVLWYTEDSEIVSVDENGVITGNSLGTTRIKAVASDGGFAAYCTVTVASSVPVNGITLSQTSGSILVGDTRQLTATVLPDNATNKSVIWSSSNTSVATVSSSGLVTGVRTGTAIITAKTQDGNYSARYSLTVTDVSVSVTGITVSPVQKTLDPNETLQLNATVIPSDATNQKVKWSTSNSSVATVSSNGAVVAKAPGTAVITVKSEDGNFTATCTVTVTSSGYVEKTLVSVSLYSAPTTTSYIYKYSDGIKLDGLKLLATYSDGSTEIISDTSKMTVSGFDASKTGTKTISVEYDGLKTEFNVTVSYAWWQWIIRILLLGFLWY